jgi:primosomal protein N'
MGKIRDAELAPTLPRNRKRLFCPECDHRLPIDSFTECDQCGAHLSLKWEIEVPGQ